MMLLKVTKRNVVLFSAAFLLCGVLHVLLYDLDFACCFSSLFCSALTVLWAVTVRKRITDFRLRTLMLWIAAFLLLQFVLQILRYDLFSGDMEAQRYLWYTMYIPMTAQPIFCYFLAVCIRRSKDERLPRSYYIFIAAGVLLVLGFLTNDLHFWAKSFPGGVLDDNGQEKSGWLFYFVEIFIYGLYAYGFGIILKKNYRCTARKYRWIAVIPLVIGGIYFLIYPFNVGHRLFGTRIWNMGEMLGFCVISTLEVCIQTGMIPANRGYETLFSAAVLPAVILDGAGNPVYKTAGARFPFEQSEDCKVVSHPIKGGSIEYLVDMKQIYLLNQQIAERAQQIEARNAYIAEETRIKRERAEVETRNRLYERISRIVEPQLEKIDTLLKSPDGLGEKELARIAVLKAYIKRRSNMELLAASGTLTVIELAAAVSESLDYVRLCGVNTASSSVGTGAYNAGMVIAAYEQIEEITEESLDTLSDMVVTVRSDKSGIVARVMLKAEKFSCETNGASKDGAGFSRKVSITKENNDIIIVLTFTEGGGVE